MNNKQLILNSDYFRDIENAIDYNSATTHGYAKKQLMHILNAFLDGKVLFIEDLGITLETIDAYKEWKKDREKLNIFNSDLLIIEIELKKSRNQKL